MDKKIKNNSVIALRRANAEKIQECEEKIVQFDLDKATKQFELDSADQQDPQKKKLEKEIFEIDKKINWHRDRIKMLNSVFS